MFATIFAGVERAKAELRRLGGDRKGVTALEYGIIAAVTVAAVGAVVSQVGDDLATVWTSIKTNLHSSLPS